MHHSPLVVVLIIYNKDISYLYDCLIYNIDDKNIIATQTQGT
jgi:hypothetical protein